MLDPTKSPILERTAVFVAIAVVCDVWWALSAPYMAAFFGIVLGDSDRALVGQVVSAIINVFLLVVGFFFGTSVGRRQQEDSINKLASTAKTAQEALTPVAAAVASAVAPDTANAKTSATKDGNTPSAD